MPPAEAALRTGFSDQRHFTNFFTRFIGLSPGTYREIFTGRRTPPAPDEPENRNTMDFTNEKCVMLIDDSLPLGLIEFPIPILKAPPERIKAIREALYEDEFAYLTVVDFSNLAQGCKTYSEFIEKMAQTDEAALSYLGIALCGNKKKMNKLTGSLPLLR